jgi:hypothetical protein
MSSTNNRMHKQRITGGRRHRMPSRPPDRRSWSLKDAQTVVRTVDPRATVVAVGATRTSCCKRRWRRSRLVQSPYGAIPAVRAPLVAVAARAFDSSCLQGCRRCSLLGELPLPCEWGVVARSRRCSLAPPGPPSLLVPRVTAAATQGGVARATGWGRQKMNPSGLGFLLWMTWCS